MTIAYDEKNQEFISVDGYKSNVYDFDNSEIDENEISSVICYYNTSHNNERNLIKCKDCGKYFIMNDGNRSWYKERNLNVPKRCYTCRWARKIRYGTER